jgi:hypothetical protein
MSKQIDLDKNDFLVDFLKSLCLKAKLLLTSKFLNYPPLPYIFRHNVRYYETSILKSDIVPAESLKIWGCTK